MARSWSFHSVALASGASPLEVEARDALVQRLAADPERASWQRASSYRVVGRPHLERAHIEHLAHLARLAKHAELEEAVRLTECTQLDYEERLVELVQVEDAACLAESARREAAARVAESVEQENAEHLAEPVQLDDADQSVGSVQLEDPELVTKRAQLEVAARLIESARLEHAARLAEYKQMTEGVESTGISSSESTTSEGSAPDAVVTPLALAFAFQRLIDQDKREFEQFVAESAAATELSGGDGSEAVSSPIEDAVGSCESPARIYLLLDYPSSVEEIDALLRLGELGNERTHATAQSSDELPLLPLIDGALLLADSLKGLQSRRKGSSIGSRRTSINPTKFDDLGTLDAFVPPSALPASSFVTANPSVAAFHEASSVGGLEWSDFVFTEVACTRIDHENTTPVQPKLADDLVREVVGTLERLAADKFAFKDWVQTTKVYSIPSSEPQSDSSQRLHRKYHQLLRPSFPASISVSTVVFALREAVARVADDEQNGGENGKQREEDGRDGLAASVDSNQEFIEYGDEAARRVARACACRDALRLKGNPVTMAAADGAGIAEVERVMWQMSDLPGVGNNGRKAFPIVSTLSPVERGVLETEFASFCPPTMSVPHVHLTRQLLQIEEVLGAMWKGKIQTREFAELLNARVFPQRLAQVLLRSPTVHKLYYPPTDALVLACISATAPGRFRTSFWSAREQVRHRPAFKDWKKERAMDPEYLTPRTAEAATACVPLSSTELEAVADKSWMFYPEDHSIVRLHQNPRGDTWLSVYQNRYAPHFICSGGISSENVLSAFCTATCSVFGLSDGCKSSKRSYRQLLRLRIQCSSPRHSMTSRGFTCARDCVDSHTNQMGFRLCPSRTRFLAVSASLRAQMDQSCNDTFFVISRSRLSNSIWVKTAVQMAEIMLKKTTRRIIESCMVAAACFASSAMQGERSSPQKETSTRSPNTQMAPFNEPHLFDPSSPLLSRRPRSQSTPRRMRLSSGVRVAS